MSEVKLVIRDAHEDRSGMVHGSVAVWFIAALSADPVSIAELDAAVDRFALESPDQGHLAHFRHCVDTEPADAGLVLIDLAARSVVIDSSYSSFGPQGSIEHCNVGEDRHRTVALRYRLADEWMFRYDTTGWEGLANIRRMQRADQPVVDLREIFYGAPMLRFIIQGCREQFARREEIARRVHREWIDRRRGWNEEFAEGPQPAPESLTMQELSGMQDPAEDIEYRIYYDTIRDIHAAWLMNPCPELNDELPRTVLLRDHARLCEDMSTREYQWTVLERCPPGISPESHAFQFSGFNTSEIVMYYDYIREVAWSCWDRLRGMSCDALVSLEQSQPQLEEFTRAEIIRLRAVGEAWLDAPWQEDPTCTPRGLILLERQRLPNAGQFHPIDPDCPCCQALAATKSIGFWHMDGCNMDDLFAFAYHYATIEEWEEDQEDNRQFSEQMDDEAKLAREWELPRKYAEPSEESDAVWQLVVNEANEEIPLGRRLAGIGHQAVSIIVRLRRSTEDSLDMAVEEHIEALESKFAKLRQACERVNEQERSSDIERCVERFIETVDWLLIEVNGHTGEDVALTDPSEATDSVTTDVGQPTSLLSSLWRVLHDGRALRALLSNFTKPSEVGLWNEWEMNDYPF